MLSIFFCDAARSNSVKRRPGIGSMMMSMSLEAVASPRATDPKIETCATPSFASSERLSRMRRTTTAKPFGAAVAGAGPTRSLGSTSSAAAMRTPVENRGSFESPDSILRIAFSVTPERTANAEALNPLASRHARMRASTPVACSMPTLYGHVAIFAGVELARERHPSGTPTP